MADYLMLCRFGSGVTDDLADLDRRIEAKMATLCPAVRLQAGYAVLGPYDMLYHFEAPDHATAIEAAMVMRSLGHSHTEVWPVVKAAEFLPRAGRFAQASADYERRIDEALEESFPASDPPAWSGCSLGRANPRSEILLCRVYDPLPAQGRRYLVDRLWPQGIRKEQLELDGWLRDLSPSSELRRWFSHDPARWEEFKRRYFSELEGKAEHWQPLLKSLEEGPVVLLYGAKDREHNNAVALKAFLEQKLSGRTPPGNAPDR